MAVGVVCALLLGACGDAKPSASSTTAPMSAAAAGSAAASTPVPKPSTDDGISGAFDIGGRSLYLECRGTGSPTVIFLTGTGGPRTQMRAIEDDLLDRPVRVCDYDRAGEGQSDPAAKPGTDVEVADDLALLLAAAHVPAPYVLIGQSVGGDQAWLYANRHPAGVVGFLIMNAGFFVLDWDKAKLVWTDDEIADERALDKAGLGEVKQAASPPGGVPYVVMMSTIAQCASTTDICGRIYPLYEAWAREIARRTPAGRFVQVAAGHEIFSDHPDAVVAEIGRLLADVH